MFDYRIAYGCWLNDSREIPIIDEDWPSIRIDADTLTSLDHTLALIARAGYNYLDVFGLITNHSWEDDIASTIDDARREQVNKVIALVHKHGLKLIYGLGVYSWGFDGIIARNAAVRGTNPQAMCASAPESDEIMRKVIDYVAQTFDVDGFHLEAADQGRCMCDKCRAIKNDIDYYNALNTKTARYIRAAYPGKTLLVNTSGYLAWGDRFDRAQLDKVATLGEEIDVFIDVASHGEFVDEADRAAFVKGFGASFGTANGFWIYPPQRWERLRWLIPHYRQNIENLGKVYRDGGRSCELYLSPLNNPGARITFVTNGLFLQNPDKTADALLREAIELLYAPADAAEREALAAIFDGAEALYFACSHPQRDRTLPESLSDGVEQVFVWSQTHPEKAVPGELFLEPLFGVGAGFPCYLTVYFDRDGRARYEAGMRALLGQAKALAEKDERAQIADIVTCIEHALEDVAAVRAKLGE